MSNSNNSQSGEPISIYKSPSQYQSQSYHTNNTDDRDDSFTPQRYSPTQPPSQTPSQPPRQYPTQYTQHPQQYSNQYPPQPQQQYQGSTYPQQYQGNYPIHPQYAQQQYPPGQYPPPYPGQPYPPGTYPPGQYPPQQMNRSYGQPRERGVFSTLFDGVYASLLGALIVTPFVQAKKMLSIRPDTPPQERFQRYRYALPQLLRQQGVASLWRDLNANVMKIPAQTLDLAFFFTIKKLIHPTSRIMPWDVAWISNVFVAGTAASLRYLVYQPVLDVVGRTSSYQSGGMKGYAGEIVNTLKNNYRNGGLKGMYQNLGVNIPMLFLYRGIQLGTIETAMQEIKHDEGHTSLIRKFLHCYVYTTMTRFILCPLEIAREEGLDEGSTAKNWKAMMRRARGVWKDGLKEYLRMASLRSFQASISAMSFAIFYHLRDDAPRF